MATVWQRLTHRARSRIRSSRATASPWTRVYTSSVVEGRACRSSACAVATSTRLAARREANVVRRSWRRSGLPRTSFVATCHARSALRRVSGRPLRPVNTNASEDAAVKLRRMSVRRRSLTMATAACERGMVAMLPEVFASRTRPSDVELASDGPRGRLQVDDSLSATSPLGDSNRRVRAPRGRRAPRRRAGACEAFSDRGARA